VHISTFGTSHRHPVLLIHGGGVAGWMWEPMRAHLRGDARLLIPDLPGHGRSAREDYVSHDATVTQLIALLERERTPAAVVGFSLGAQLGVLLAARRPDLVDRVAVVSAQAIPLRSPRLALALIAATAGLAQRSWFARAQAKALFVSDPLMADYIRTSATISRATLLNAVGENISFTVPAAWSDFAGKAVMVAGSRERALMKKSAMRLHENLPHSTVEIVDGCGHGIPLQRPEWFAKKLRTWLDDDSPKAE
jgi:pimeloyl-ACP methyl ester carboxylesterase